jgi:hypothetical protein
MKTVVKEKKGQLNVISIVLNNVERYKNVVTHLSNNIYLILILCKGKLVDLIFCILRSKIA